MASSGQNATQSRLSFTAPALINISKFGILVGSVISAAAGIIFLMVYISRTDTKKAD
jgi:Na+/H+ antiporter NhaA